MGTTLTTIQSIKTRTFLPVVILIGVLDLLFPKEVKDVEQTIQLENVTPTDRNVWSFQSVINKKTVVTIEIKPSFYTVNNLP